MNHRQDGLALVVVLIVLTIGSAFALLALERGLLGLRITERSEDRAEVFELAEAALAVAGESPQSRAGMPLVPDPGADSVIWARQLRAVGQPLAPPGFATENRVVYVLVEDLDVGYRITSLARDDREQVTVILQSVQSASGEQRIWRQLR